MFEWVFHSWFRLLERVIPFAEMMDDMTIRAQIWDLGHAGLILRNPGSILKERRWKRHWSVAKKPPRFLHCCGIVKPDIDGDVPVQQLDPFSNHLGFFVGIIPTIDWCIDLDGFLAVVPRDFGSSSAAWIRTTHFDRLREVRILAVRDFFQTRTEIDLAIGKVSRHTTVTRLDRPYRPLNIG